jgi:nicotinate phosphoribosyltransferase
MTKSLLDTDFYILTMQQAIFHKYTSVDTKFEFKWRNWEKMELRISMDDFIGRLKDKLDALCELRYTKDELAYLSEIPFVKPDFVEYLRLFQLNRGYILPYKTKEGGLGIDIHGPLVNVIPFEVPVLSIISQLYTESSGQTKFNWLLEGRDRLNEKMKYLDANLHRDMKFGFADFGTRRRADRAWHQELLETIMKTWPTYLTGTSNIHFAKEFGIKAIGTMAHLWFQIHQQLGSRLIDSQSAALQAWADEYRGELGIALSDTLGFSAFLVDFDRYFALLFDGCRHDSGDPIRWCEKLISHYHKLRIDPKTKTAVFSDGLTFQVAVGLFLRFHNHINTSYGIGTYLTNDCGFLAPQIVIKNTSTNGKPTAKISDTPGKGMCMSESFEGYLRGIIEEKIDGIKYTWY